MTREKLRYYVQLISLPILLISAALLLLPKNDFDYAESPLVAKTNHAQKVSREYKLLFMGDTMVARSIGSGILQGSDPYMYVKDYLATYDLKIANVETTIAPPESAIQAKGKAYTFNAPIQTISTLKKYLDVAVLANNHTKDFGSSATSAMLDAFSAQKLPTVGAGKNVDEAFAPFIAILGDGKTSPQVKVGFIAMNAIENNYTVATQSAAGSAYFDESRILKAIAAAHEQGAGMVIAVAHWGIEYTSTPTADQKKWAHYLIDNGVDAVIGGHPHVIQPTEVYKNKPIVYSMGNFIFDGMSGSALEGQMISVELHVEANKTTNVKATSFKTTNVRITGTQNIPIYINALGYPVLKK